jgi:hypothetical protein
MEHEPWCLQEHDESEDCGDHMSWCDREHRMDAECERQVEDGDDLFAPALIGVPGDYCRVSISDDYNAEDLPRLIAQLQELQPLVIRSTWAEVNNNAGPVPPGWEG